MLMFSSLQQLMCKLRHNSLNYITGGGELGEGSGVGTDGLQGWILGRGGDLAGGSPYPQGEEGLPGNRPRGGDVEGSGGDSK